MLYVRLIEAEHRAVQVHLADGTCAEGWLEAYRQEAGVWAGCVRYRSTPYETRTAWFPEEHIEGANLH